VGPDVVDVGTAPAGKEKGKRKGEKKRKGKRKGDGHVYFSVAKSH
jgi:hypothetical protein